MDPGSVKRRLTCILAADAVGYSRLMSENEAETLRVLTAHRSVIDGIIAFHEGRIVGTAGDSVLAEFGSAVEAVRCAVEIQDALRTRNESLPEGRRLPFRVGVNLGDVVVKGTDLLGDGVNIAARLEGIAPPGGIVISSSVYDQITGKLDLGFHDIGPQSLKNITHPVRAFTVSGAGGTVRPAATERRHRAWPWLAAAAVLAIVAITGIAWQSGRLEGVLPGTRTASSPPVPPAPDAERARLAAQVTAAEQARVAAEARANAADAEIARERAERDAAAVRAKAQAEAAATKAKAEADAALLRSKAAADAQAAMEKTKAADDATARAARDAAALREQALADAETAKARNVDAAAAKAAAARFDPSIYDGAWTGTLACDSVDEIPAGTQTIPVKAGGGMFSIDWPVAGTSGGGHAEGRPSGDGSLTLRGSSIARTKRSFGKTIGVRFDGSLKERQFELRGHIGLRNCSLVLARAG